MNSRWVAAVLLLALMASMAAMVYVRHEARRSFMALQDAEADRDALAVDFGRLQLEYATWAEGGRVEALAREELGLDEADPEQVSLILK